MLICGICNRKFASGYSLRRHKFRIHQPKGVGVSCHICGKHFSTDSKLLQHRHLHKDKIVKYHKLEHAYNSRVSIWRKNIRKIYSSAETAFMDEKNALETLVGLHLNRLKYIRAAIIFHLEFSKVSSSHEKVEELCIRRSGSILSHKSQIPQFMENSLNYLHIRLNDLEQSGSGFVLRDVLRIDLSVAQIRTMNGSCGPLIFKSFFQIERLVPIYQTSKDCFLRAFAAYFFSEKNYFYNGSAELEIKIKKFIKNKIIMRFHCPMAVVNIQDFETDNKHLNVKIYLYYAKFSF